jgi:NADPH:quinone reductase-like Zn-dependent oxidoreductase
VANTMRVAEFDEYGPASVLKVRTVLRPTPEPGEALVRIHASGGNGSTSLVPSRSGRP